MALPPVQEKARLPHTQKGHDFFGKPGFFKNPDYPISGGTAQILLLQVVALKEILKKITQTIFPEYFHGKAQQARRPMKLFAGGE